ncbi:anaphase-promoting complex subunit Hcn1 [Chytriomyces hyalinus]|nr:anaphase-promoting complex subunit Hcn1 [Chytriomyces hyalinus]
MEHTFDTAAHDRIVAEIMDLQALQSEIVHVVGGLQFQLVAVMTRIHRLLDIATPSPKMVDAKMDVESSHRHANLPYRPSPLRSGSIQKFEPHQHNSGEPDKFKQSNTSLHRKKKRHSVYPHCSDESNLSVPVYVSEAVLIPDLDSIASLPNPMLTPAAVESTIVIPKYTSINTTLENVAQSKRNSVFGRFSRRGTHDQETLKSKLPFFAQENATQPHVSNDRAKELWAILRKSVMAKADRRRAAAALPAFFTLAKTQRRIQPPPAVVIRSVPFNSLHARFHWFFLCPAFNERGKFVSIRTYHKSDWYRPHEFLTDGINPLSVFFAVLNTTVIIFFLLRMLILPYYGAFVANVAEYRFIYQFGLPVDLIDTLLNICTPKATRKTDNKIHVQRNTLRQWIIVYAKNYIAVDVMTLIPWVYFVSSPSLVLPVSLIYLLRIHRLPSMMSRSPPFVIMHRRIESIVGIGNMLARIIPVSIAVILFLHFQACIIYWVGNTLGFTSWNRIFERWRLSMGGIQEATLVESPETIPEQITSQIFVLIGGVLYAIFVGLISSAAISYDASGQLYRQKIDELTEYLRWKSIDAGTQEKLLDYYELKYRGKYFEEKNLLADLNESLRKELACITCKKLIEKVPFLKRSMLDGRDDLYLGRIATALTPLYFVAGDAIINQGERATEMFFLLGGTVNIIVNNNCVASFHEGSFFGEVALISDIPRTATVRAATACNVYSLSAKAFHEIILEFDDMRERIDQIYEERMVRVRMETVAKEILGREKLEKLEKAKNKNDK